MTEEMRLKTMDGLLLCAFDKERVCDSLCPAFNITVYVPSAPIKVKSFINGKETDTWNMVPVRPPRAAPRCDRGAFPIGPLFDPATFKDCPDLAKEYEALVIEHELRMRSDNILLEEVRAQCRSA